MLLTATLVSLGLFAPQPGLHAQAQATEEAGVTRESAGRRRLHVEGSPVLVETWTEARPVGRAVELYRISLDGTEFSRVREVRPELALVWGTFDPLVSAPDHADSSLAAAGELHIVQFVTQSLQAYRDELTRLGAQVSRPLAHQANLVRMDAATTERVAALPWVRWVGAYHPLYRLEPTLAGRLGAEPLPPARYRIQVLERGPAQKELVAERLLTLGATVDELYSDGFLFDATLTEAALRALVTWDEVLYVDRWSPPEEDMNLVRSDGGANFIETTLGLTGAGVRGEVCDGNLLGTHPDLQSNPVIWHGNHVGDQSHGTSATGVVFGDGATDATARGLLPDGQPVFGDYGQMGSRYTHTAQLLQSPYHCVFQSNSWGSTRTSLYNNTSAELDDILFLNDVLLVQSQSNSGTTDSRPQAWAKNIVSVGGIYHQSTLNTGDDSWGGSASIGPASDGRIKPDLHYWYDSIWTCADTGGHRTFCCTSAATPCVAGHFGLFYELWHSGVWPGRGGASSVFASKPKTTTARALVINSAWSYSFSGTGSDLTRVHQGWGRPDLERLYELADRTFIIDEEEVLQNLESVSYDVNVVPGEPEFRATLVYLDRMGTASSSVHRVNDLSLRVTAPGGLVYWGNNGLNAGTWSSAGGSSNTRDVVENVFIQSPAPGTWTVEVLADEVVQDTHTETPTLDADFALVVTGVDSNACPWGQNYCLGAPNSAGLDGATMSYVGSTSVAANDLWLSCTGLPAAEFGVFFYGPYTHFLGFGDGFLCIDGTGGGGLHRLNPPQLVSPFGTVQREADYAEAPLDSGAGAIVPGSVYHFQFWYRDGPGTFNLSDGLTLTFCP